MADTPITEDILIQAQLQAAYDLLTNEIDVFEEMVLETGEVVYKKTGTRKGITPQALQAATGAINSKAAQKHFAEQRRGSTINVRKELRRGKELTAIEVLDE